ncbi:hypothetical protein EG861_14325, partial [Enterococcus faecalis]
QVHGGPVAHVDARRERHGVGARVAVGRHLVVVAQDAVRGLAQLPGREGGRGRRLLLARLGPGLAERRGERQHAALVDGAAQRGADQVPARQEALHGPQHGGGLQAAGREGGARLQLAQARVVGAQRPEHGRLQAQRLALAQRLRRLRHHAAQRPRVGAHVRAVRVNLGVEGAHGVHDVRQAPRAQAGPALAGREDGGRAPAEDEAAGEEALERHH